MRCIKCGIDNDPSQTVCNGCGAPLTNPKNTNTKEGKKKNILWTVLAVGGLFAIGVISNATNSSKINDDALDDYYAGDMDSAITQFQKASDYADDLDTKITTLKNLAYAYDASGDTDSAIKTFNEALALCKKNSFDYYLISGEIALTDNNPELAKENFEKAEKINSEDYQLNNTMALLYLDYLDEYPEFADYDLALKYAKKTYKLDEDKTDTVKFTLAVAYFFNDEYDQTISLLSKVNLDVLPDAAFWLGLSYMLTDDEVNAKKYLKIALDNDVPLPEEFLDYINS